MIVIPKKGVPGFRKKDWTNFLKNAKYVVLKNQLESTNTTYLRIYSVLSLCFSIRNITIPAWILMFIISAYRKRNRHGINMEPAKEHVNAPGSDLEPDRPIPKPWDPGSLPEVNFWR